MTLAGPQNERRMSEGNCPVGEIFTGGNCRSRECPGGISCRKMSGKNVRRRGNVRIPMQD